MKRATGTKPDKFSAPPDCRCRPVLGRIAVPALALLAFIVALTPDLTVATESTAGRAGIEWLRSDTEAFAKARSERRYVLLYLEAVWCHWCHVMDEKTYGDAAIRSEINAHYVPLRIDQDLRPDLSNRYKDYGWPATVVFAADGSEIVKRQGFVEPERFLRLLKAIEADPSPEAADTIDQTTEVPAKGALDEKTRAELVKRHLKTHDAALGGLTTGQKYLDRDSVEYELVLAHSGDAGAATFARATLDAARALFDPVWGGVYQYSTYGDWKHPHYEKLATVQAQYLRIYALAWATFARDGDRRAVQEIRRYLDAFLKAPDGAFYVSQDADLRPGEHSDAYFALDDAHRRAQGLPRIDRHLYTLQNGQIIEALATWAELGGDADALAEAVRAAQWVIGNRALADGGYRHDANDAAGPYLGDTLAMARAFLALYRATADRIWLTRASASALFIAGRFAGATGGYLSARSSGPIAAMPQLDENISFARFANLLARYSGDAGQRASAETALAYLADPRVALSEITEPGILLADDELHADPLHLTITGAKTDPAAKVLFSTVQHLAPWYKRVEWWDRAEGELPNPDVGYPLTKSAAAFVCTSNRCSLPIFSAAEIVPFLLDSAAAAKPAAAVNTTATHD
ncbi:MAG TPA: DUF255 domain-containing protein [Rudaea sp.]|nr:DUF255 domain-containing protein [Rudaea sp.]